jgi:hypothetical protein
LLSSALIFRHGKGMSLQNFLSQLETFATNNITALMGTIQVTSHERETLKALYVALSKEDQAVAKQALKDKGVDVSGF